MNELEHLPVICNDRDLLKFNAPPNQTCGEYLANFFSNGAPGYVVDPNALGECQYCTYESGKQYYTLMFNWDAANKWRDFGIIVCYFAFNTLVFIVLCYFKRRERR